MNWLFLLDVLLIVLGVLALAPRLLGRGKRTAAVLAFYAGFAMLGAAGADLGLVEWDEAHRPNSEGIDAAAAARIDEYCAREAMAWKAKGPVDAPDFCLPVLDEGRSIRLSDFRGRKPVVLLFGSFS